MVMNSVVRSIISTYNMTATHDFIDNSLVGVEVEGQAGVAAQRRSASA